jgi:hypothetical protein
MTARILLVLPSAIHRPLWSHLDPQPRTPEQAAFAFAIRNTDNGDDRYHCVEWFAVPPEGFESRSSVHFEITDKVRAQVIKRAHDLGASLVEFHSHTGPWPAAFSVSDILGFRDFVPHVWWRLKGRPYLAVVVAPTGVDALAWVRDPGTPLSVDAIETESGLVHPTGLTRWGVDPYEE